VTAAEDALKMSLMSAGLEATRLLETPRGQQVVNEVLKHFRSIDAYSREAESIEGELGRWKDKLAIAQQRLAAAEGSKARGEGGRWARGKSNLRGFRSGERCAAEDPPRRREPLQRACRA
jgi:hypothetical protein